jgi:6-phosphogluconolactonase
VTLALEVVPDARAAANRVAALIGDRAMETVPRRGASSFAVSGGTTPMEMFRAFEDGDQLPWQQIAVYQVDERVAPAGHPDRNLTHLLAALPPAARGSVRPMPVEDPDLEQAAERYAAELPAQLDIVHLGLGPDGHTASLVPGDPVLEVSDRLVAVTGEYRGLRRMTLTYPALDAALEIVWLITGRDKRDAVARLLARDTSIPAARISNPRQLLVCDAEAAPSN